MWSRPLAAWAAPECDERPIYIAPFAGQLAGASTAIVSNPLSHLKYRQYGRQKERSFFRELESIRRSQKGLSRGLGPSLMRDSVFGCTFTTLRAVMAKRDAEWARQHPAGSNKPGSCPVSRQLLVDCGAGCLACVMSGPFNYVRNQQYAYVQISGAPFPSTALVFSDLAKDVVAGPSGWWTLLNSKLRIGWGSLRVGMGMAGGSYFYRCFLGKIDAPA